jgi:DNA-binding MarR family transcriptional regulator
MARKILNQSEFETLSDFRYRLRCFIRFSEELTHQYGITNLQYLLMLHIKGYKGREWATIGELAERLQSHHHGVVSLVSRCEKLGLVYKKRGIVDKREVEVHLTAEGDKLVKIIAALHRDELLNQEGFFRIPGAQELGHD